MKKKNYSKNLKTLKFSKRYFKNRTTLSKFVHSLHDLVNKELKKKSIDYNDMCSDFELYRSGEIKKKTLLKISKK